MLRDRFFYRAANVPKAGGIVCAYFLQAMCFHRGELVLSLLFSALSKVGAIKVCFLQLLSQQHLLKTCMIYNIFGSGANHGIHAQFMSQTSIFNERKKIILMCGERITFATVIL